MVSVKIFVEGGGQGKDLKSRCREGFSKLIERMGFEGRMPRIVACGGRQSAYDMFCIAVTSAEHDEYPILLVDSEDPISSEKPWDHLRVRDHWDRPANASDEQAQMMATCMETWIMGDHEALQQVFGSCLRRRSLLPSENLEKRSRQELLEALKSATVNCGKNKGYDKGERSFLLLAELNPRSLKNLRYFCRFRDTLNRHL